MCSTFWLLLQVKELQYRVLDQELNKWKREQQLSGNGAPFSNNLDTIQKWSVHAPLCTPEAGS